MSASVDFRMEFGVDAINEFPLAEVLHIEPDPGPDMAFFRLSRQGASPGATTGNPVRLSARAPANDRRVAVIGYPAFDSRIPEPDTLRNIFGETFDIKRLAPGEIMRTDAAAVEHDASTLGGNSGSVVMDLETGKPSASTSPAASCRPTSQSRAARWPRPGEVRT